MLEINTVPVQWFTFSPVGQDVSEHGGKFDQTAAWK